MKIKRWKTLMVAVKDFDRDARALLRKAAAIAERFGAELIVLHVSASDDEAFTIPARFSTLGSADEIRRVQQQRLEKMAKTVQASGRRITCLSVLDYPIVDGIVRQVIKHKPDLLMVQSPHHSRVARMFLTNTDWELIRHCPCPLWLAKSTRLKPALSVLASIDPFHSHAKPADLDKVILDAAGQVVGTGTGRLGITHVYTVPPKLFSAAGEIAVIPATPAQSRRYKAQARSMIKRLGKPYAVSTRDQLPVEGDPAVRIPQLAKSWKADVLVMGAVSRRAMKRLFIGHTAERILDEVHCDVLVVKPASFKTQVRG
jgi:universal stress protein E